MTLLLTVRLPLIRCFSALQATIPRHIEYTNLISLPTCPKDMPVIWSRAGYMDNAADDGRDWLTKAGNIIDVWQGQQ